MKEQIVEHMAGPPWNGGEVVIDTAKFETGAFLVLEGISVCTPKHHRAAYKC